MSLLVLQLWAGGMACVFAWAATSYYVQKRMLASAPSRFGWLQSQYAMIDCSIAMGSPQQSLLSVEVPWKKRPAALPEDVMNFDPFEFGAVACSRNAETCPSPVTT